MGSGRYINNNPSKMTLHEYRKISEKNQNLANISLRGAVTNVDLDQFESKTTFSP